MAIPAVTNNSPAAGSIAWAAFSIQYQGVSYSIPAGNTAARWVWWRYNGGSSVIEAGADVPSDLTDDDLVLFGNKGGIAVRIQSSSLVDGELLVDGSILARALSVEAVTTDHLLAGDALINGLLQVVETVSLAVSTNGLFVGPNISLTQTDGFVAHTPLGDTVIPADGQAPVFTGSATFDALTALGNLKIQGLTNEVAKGSVLRLASGTTAPKTSPAGSSYWPNKTIQTGFNPRGLAYHGGSGRYYMVESLFGANIDRLNEGTSMALESFQSISGNAAGDWNRPEVIHALGGLAIISNNIYVLCQTNEVYPNTYYGKWYIYKGVWNSITSRWDYVTRYLYDAGTTFLGGYSQYNPAIGVRESTGNLVIAQCSDGGALWLTTYNTSGVQQSRVAINKSDGSQWSPSANMITCGFTSGDFGSERFYLIKEGDSASRFYNPSTLVPNSDGFPLPTSAPVGFLWDSSKSTWRTRGGGILYDHTGILVSTIAAVMTWRKANATSPAFAQYETDKSRPWITTSFPKRAALLLNAGTIPDDITDPNDPDSVTFYVAQNDLTGLNSSYKRQTPPAAGVASVGYISLSTTGANPPAAPNFPAGTPARVLSNDGLLIDLRGNGQGRVGPLEWDSQGVLVRDPRRPGEITMWGGNSVPSGWLACNGQAVSRTTYSALYAAIGTLYGPGDGSTTFNVPDFRGRFPFGPNSSGGVKANLGDSEADVSGVAPGAANGGRLDHRHTHTVNAHDHGLSSGTTQAVPTGSGGGQRMTGAGTTGTRAPGTDSRGVGDTAGSNNAYHGLLTVQFLIKATV